MKSIAVMSLIGLVGTISCATAPVAVTLDSLCNPPDLSYSGYIFENLNQYSSIEVTNEGAINCPLIVRVDRDSSDNYEVTMYIDTFTYDCEQFESVNDQVTCKGISNGKQEYKSGLVLPPTGGHYNRFLFQLPKVSGDTAKGKLKAYVTLVSKQDRHGKCLATVPLVPVQPVNDDKEDTVFKCADKTCIYGDYKCNGVFNCNDKSDEADALCKPKAAGLGWLSWLLIGVAVAIALGGGAYIAYVKFVDRL
ncbi:hypothetical protein HDE_08843 [Halotydeus destructor]|nr:hypothetical protein HDE_08843 [Halotydeus destructor]